MTLPKFTCVSGCAECCKASLAPFTGPERQRIEAVRPDLQWTDWTKPGEPPLWVLSEQLATMRCPLLTEDDRCSVHSIRPTVCQLYGLVDAPGMRCPKGGKAERMLTDKESRRISRRALR